MRVVELWRGDQGWPGGISDGLDLDCSACGHRPAFDYIVSDELWTRVVPSLHKTGVVCLRCFDDMATEAGYHTGDHLQEVQFTGRGKTIMLVPAIDYRYEK